MIAPILPDLEVTRAYIDTYINAYSDNVSGTTSPPTCGARICTSDHPNVLWEKVGQKFKVSTKGLGDIVGTSIVTLSCKLELYS